MTRDGKPIEPLWLHIAVNGALDTVRSDCRSRARVDARLANTELSVNLKDDGTEALVKVAGQTDLRAWLDAQGWRTKVIRAFTRRDHGEALTLVKAEGWEHVAESTPR